MDEVGNRNRYAEGGEYMSDYDTWKTTPPEPDIVGKCDYCDDELYAGCDYLHDRNENEWFCGMNCYLDKRREGGDLAMEVINRDA